MAHQYSGGTGLYWWAMVRVVGVVLNGWTHVMFYSTGSRGEPFENTAVEAR